MLSNWPNILTIGRVALVPAIVCLFYVPGDLARYAACALFVIAAVTDWLDGHLARSWNQQSPFGRWLDPVADKLLVAAVVVMLVAYERAPAIPAVIIVSREIMVSGLREYMAEVRLGLPVSKLAKWKTAVQMVALPILIVGEAGPAWLPTFAIGWWALWLAAALTLVTGWDYLRLGVAHMRKEEEARTSDGEG